jgi:hypothetical protein
MVATSSRVLSEALNQLKADLGLLPQELASALGVTTATVDGWRHGDSTPHHEARRRFDELVAIRHHLFETFDPNDVVSWLHESHHYLGGRTPAASIQAGEGSRVEALLTVIDHGIFT